MSFECVGCSKEMRRVVVVDRNRGLMGTVIDVQVTMRCDDCTNVERYKLRYSPKDYARMCGTGEIFADIDRKVSNLRGRTVPIRPSTSPPSTDGCPLHPRTTTDKYRIAPNCLSIRLNKSDDMRLMETIEDGSKAQIVLEDISPRDADAIHAFQLAQGRGRLVISESGITFEG